MKLNNKGFSMIEILAVVVIVAIVSVIGIVSVTRLIEKSRQHFYENQEKQIVLAAQAYARDNKNILPKEVGQISTVYLDDLIKNNYIKDEITDEDKNPCYTKPETIKDKDGNEVNIDGTHVDIYKVNQTEYTYTGNLQCEKCLETRNYRAATCSSSSDKEKPHITIDIPKVPKEAQGNTIYNKDRTIKITIDALENNDHNALVSSYSYKIYVDNKLVKDSGTKMNGKKPQITINNEYIYQYVPGVVKVVVKATNTDGKTASASASSDLSDAAHPLCGNVKYDNNNQMKDYEYVTPDNIKCGSTNYSWINIGTNPGDRHVWVLCNDEEGVGCQLTEYSLYLNEDGDDQDVVLKDTKNNKFTCSVKKCIDKTTPKITFNIRNSKTGTVKKKYTINGQQKELNYVHKETYNKWLNKANYQNGVFLDVVVNDPTSKIRSFTWTESDSVDSLNLLGAANNKVITKNNVKKAKLDDLYHKVTEDGYKLERVKVEDYAGNILDFRLIIKIDRTKPTCSLGDWDNECENSGVTVKLYCNDDMSGVDSCGGTSKNGAKNTNVKKTGLKSDKTYNVTDIAENKTSCTATIDKDEQWRKATCSTCGRCSAAGCDIIHYSIRHSYGLVQPTAGCQHTASLTSCGLPANFNTSSICCDTQTKYADGCDQYTQSCPICGCSSWGNWSAWSYNQLNCNGTTKNTCKIDTQYVYRHQSQHCKNGVVTPSNKKVKCSAGNYLPAGQASCATCKSAYYCPGGEWYVNNSKDQGLNDCPAGYKNSDPGSSKITQCYMNVNKNHYVAKAKDSSATKCAPGYIKNFHKVFYNSTSSCELYSARKLNGIYVECDRTPKPDNGNWTGDCSQRYIFSEGGMDVGTYRVKVTENAVTFQGFCNVIQTSGLTYCYTIYALDENGHKDSDTILMNKHCLKVFGKPTGPYGPENRARVVMNWKTQKSDDNGPDIPPKDSDCYDHGNHDL